MARTKCEHDDRHAVNRKKFITLKQREVAPYIPFGKHCQCSRGSHKAGMPTGIGAIVVAIVATIVGITRATENIVKIVLALDNQNPEG